MAVAAGFELVGREAELARLRQFVDDLARGPGAAVIRGEAGIGKTVLWRAALEAAEQAGSKILVTRCAEAEIPLGLGGVGDLLDDALAAVADDLPEPHRHALAAVVGDEMPTDETPDPLDLPRAFLACLRALADRTPVLLAVDDVQWLDTPSQRILAFAARRLRDARVGILATHRGETGDPLDLRNAFDERFAEIRVGPLSVGALHHLIRTRLGARIPRPTVARVHEASGGNPMFALEFAKLTASAGAPLPVPSSLEELTRGRIAALPPEVLALLAVVAAVERPTASLVEAVVDDGAALLDAAVSGGSVTSGPDGAVSFTHPLTASAAYAAVPASVRRAMHLRLAGATDDDPEERARHVALATTECDAGAAQLLDEAAARARSRGAPDAAATFARHAIRLTPPADAAALEERRIALASHLIDAGQMATAQALLDELLADEISGSPRARALLLAFLAESDLEAARRLAEEALEHAGDDIALRVRALLYLGSYPLAHGDLEAGERIAREALRLAEELGDPDLLAATLTCVGQLAEMRGYPEPALLERAIALGGSVPPVVGGPPRVVLGQQRLVAGDLPGARELLEAEVEAARGSGEESMTLPALPMLIELEWREGDWERAERYIDVLSQHVFDGEDPYGEAGVRWWQGVLAAGRGRVDEARELAHEAVRRGEEFHVPWRVARGQWLLAFVSLSLHEPAEAWEALHDLPERPEVLSRRESGNAPILPDAVEAAVAAGHVDDAEAVLGVFVAGGRTKDHPWATPAVLRCRALLLLARGETDAALATADEAAAGFAAAGFPLDHGRALLVAGEALRRLGERRRAAEKLEAAKAIFSELGAPLWLARAEKELRRASPRPRRDGDLTNAERRVAALVAAGRTNREVAAQLFTTVGTVEVHLTRIYRKLELRSRTELARLVADGTLVLADD